VIGAYLTDKPGFVRDIVRPLQEKAETVYVVPGSDAEAYVARHFPAKNSKPVSNGLRPRSIKGFLAGLPLTFQPGQSKGMNATYHLTFTGAEQCLATIVIRDGTLTVEDGHIGTPDLRVTADSKTWLDFVAKEKSLVWALLTRRLRLKGPPGLLVKFGKCFPS
jgi:hypothetical protein